MNDALARAMRTFVQAFTGMILLQLAAIGAGLADGSWIPDLEWLKRVGLSATTAGAISIVTFLHNWSEDKGMPALLNPTDRAIGDDIIDANNNAAVRRGPNVLDVDGDGNDDLGPVR